MPFLGMEKTGKSRFGEINQEFSLGNVMFFFCFKFIYLLIYGCVGSSFL